MHWVMEERRGTGRKPPWNLACKFISESINHSSIKEKEQKGNTPFDLSNPAELLLRDPNSYSSLILDLYLPVTSMWLPVCQWEWFRSQLDTLCLAVFICSRAAAAQLCTLGCREPKELDPATSPCQEKETDQAGSLHPDNPDVVAPRWKLHSSTPQCVWLFVGSHMLLHILPFLLL